MHPWLGALGTVDVGGLPAQAIASAGNIGEAFPEYGSCAQLLA